MPLTQAKEEYFSDLQGIRFLMQDGNKEVPCRISHEALIDRGRATDLNETQVFDTYRDEIEQAASDKYDRDGADEEGRIVVTTAEFPQRT